MRLQNSKYADRDLFQIIPQNWGEVLKELSLLQQAVFGLLVGVIILLSITLFKQRDRALEKAFGHHQKQQTGEIPHGTRILYELRYGE